jgi:hypothetical protein
MALTDRREQQIEVRANEEIGIREARIIMDNGVEISRTYNRIVITPADDANKYNGRIRRVAASVHVPTVVNRYKARIDRDDKKVDFQQKKRASRGTEEDEAAEALAEQALLDAEAVLEAAEAAHEAFLASEDS